MRNGKYAAPRKRRGNAKVWATVLALTLALGCVAGGTLAWLTATTGPITNTFTIGDINISLSDTKGTFNGNDTAVSTSATTYVPGQVIPAEPMVTVTKDSEACYLFIHIKEDNNTLNNDKVIKWDLWTAETRGTSAEWKEVPNHSGYYYRTVGKEKTSDAKYYIFKDSKLTVNSELSKEIINGQGFQNPTITITAAAVQRDNIPNESNDEVTAAWALLPPDFTGTTTSGT